MLKKIIILFALAAASVAQQPAKTKVAASAPAAGGTIVLKGGKLLTITHGVIENGVVVMENGRITAVGAASTSIPRNAKGNYDWNALPDGLYLIEWRAGGKRRRESAGVTAEQALESQRRKRHELEGRKLGVAGR